MGWPPDEVFSMAKTREVRIKITEPRLVAYTVHKGSYAQLGKVFRMVARWAHENGYEVAGWPTSTYYNEAGSVPDDELITEVQIPIRKATEGEHYIEFTADDGAKVKVRPAKIDDASSLQRNCLPANTIDEVKGFLEKDVEEMKRGNKVRLVADISGEVIGNLELFFSQHPLMFHTANISAVVVNPRFRRKRMAAKMIEMAFEIAKERAVKIVKTEVEAKNAPAVKLYLKAGFKEYGRLERGLVRNGEFDDLILLKKDLL